MARVIFLNEGSKRVEPSSRGIPVMFFGKREVAWMQKKCVTLWSKGIKTIVKRMKKEERIRRADTNGSRSGLHMSIEQVIEPMPGLSS